MEAWQKKIKSWLQCNISQDFCDVDEETLAPLLLRAKNHYSEKTLLVVLPVLTMAEQLASNMQLWLDEFQVKHHLLFIPETVSGGNFIPENEPARAQALYNTITKKYDFIVLSAPSLIAKVLAPKLMRESEIILSPGDTYPIHDLLEKLVLLDYDDEFETNVSGEFSRRGGIIDVFSLRHDFPVRIEFWGDQIESIRKFDPKTQRSTEKIDKYHIIPRAGIDDGNFKHDFIDYLEKINPQIMIVFPDECSERLEKFASEPEINRFKDVQQRYSTQQLFRVSIQKNNSVPQSNCFPATNHLKRTMSAESMDGEIELLRQIVADQIRQWLDSDYELVLLGNNINSCGHIKKWCERYDLPINKLKITTSNLVQGIIFPSEKICFLTENELFASTIFKHKTAIPDFTQQPRTSVNEEASSFADLDEGDFAVHLIHGIGIFRGIKEIDQKGIKREVMVLEYQDNAMVYIPMWQSGMVSRYIGAQHKVNIHKIGSKKWNAAKIDAVVAVRNFASDMLRFQAVRNASIGIAFPSDNLDQRIFEEAFPFDDTRDQKKVVAEIKIDMEKARPMDRLLCGDVGYGKTEVAIRIAFKAVAAGFQVAILVPTTILAQQHYYSFRERFSQYPFIIEMLSRFRSASEQKEIIERMKKGSIDIIIGTHRIVQSDISFAKLGLVIIDEEQRFGVKQKEQLKHLRSTVDVLTMSATPIPRTLYMAMTGARDLSTIMTAPGLRQPIQTTVAQHDDKFIIDAIRNEIRRGGQVFYIHNRIKTIEETADRLKGLLPDISIAIAHGQMDEDELELIMGEFLAGTVNVLVCTTIIESGLDIPNANTIIIERADRFGLAELYQLRGRVGRWNRQAYAYLLLPHEAVITSDARKRLAAIRRYTHLGAGFRLALRDLEIRGAGNLLGAEQSGHIDSIGFDLYCQLLRSEIARSQGQPEQYVPSVDINIEFVDFAHDAPEGHLAAGFPPEYIPSERLRIEIYRRLGIISTIENLNEFEDEIEDRFGNIPESGINMLKITEIKILVAVAGYNSVTVTDNKIYIKNDQTVYRPNGSVPAIHPQNPAKFKLKYLLEIARLLPSLQAIRK